MKCVHIIAIPVWAINLKDSTNPGCQFVQTFHNSLSSSHWGNRENKQIHWPPISHQLAPPAPVHSNVLLAGTKVRDQPSSTLTKTLTTQVRMKIFLNLCMIWLPTDRCYLLPDCSVPYITAYQEFLMHFSVASWYSNWLWVGRGQPWIWLRWSQSPYNEILPGKSLIPINQTAMSQQYQNIFILGLVHITYW